MIFNINKYSRNQIRPSIFDLNGVANILNTPPKVPQILTTFPYDPITNIVSNIIFSNNYRNIQVSQNRFNNPVTEECTDSSGSESENILLSNIKYPKYIYNNITNQWEVV